MGIVLDTSIFVDAERKHLPLAGFLRGFQQTFGPEDLVISTVTVSEMEHGIWRAQDAQRQQRRERFLTELLAAVPAYPLTTEIARQVGKIDANCRKAGNVIPFQDLVIGVTALQFGFSVATLNTRHFGMIPNLTVRSL